MTRTFDLTIDRKVTSRDSDGAKRSNALASWRSAQAYVLLGEPGSGKTTSLKAEAAALGDDAKFFTARDFLALELRPVDADKVLFIDALDERLTAASDPTSPFDDIRRKLSSIANPRFRISCREADWFADGLKDLQAAVPEAALVELTLDPLTDEEIGQILAAWSPSRVADPSAFMNTARSRNVDHLLHNPLLLDLLVDAVKGGHWPDSREQTYRLACERLAQEQDPAHRKQVGRRASPAELSRVAGLVSASMLLSGQATLSLEASGVSGDSLSMDSVASELALDPAALLQCLNSKLFAAEGLHRAPRHRTIAEYLGAKALSDLAGRGGIPLGRLMALMTGFDGRVIDALRGLYAWLTVHDARDRALLVDYDPLALVLYGDAFHFSASEKKRVLFALQREGERFKWFRNENWIAQPFGTLGTPDMEATFRAWLVDPSRESAHQVALDCVIDAVQYGDAFPGLLGELQRVARDDTYWPVVRSSALEAWYAKPGFDVEAARRMLEDLRSGKVTDEDDELAGSLLRELYPKHLEPTAALRHLRPRRRALFIGAFHMFWAVDFLAMTPSSRIPEVVDRLAVLAKAREVLDDEDTSEPRFKVQQELTAKAALRAIIAVGDETPLQRLHSWINACLGKYRWVEQNDEALQIRAWLEERPDLMIDLYAFDVSWIDSGHAETRRLDDASAILLHARRPRDWYRRVLGIAGNTDSAEAAAHYVKSAAEAALSLRDDVDVTLHDVERWVLAHAERWPDAQSWLDSVTAWPLDPNRSKELKRVKRARAERIRERAERQRAIAPHLAEISSVAANLKVLDSVAHAHWTARHETEGPTALERIAEVLVAGPKEAQDALDGVRAALDRTDIPSVDAIFELAKSGKSYYLGSVCQLAAELRFESDPATFRTLGDAVLRKLVAFHLVRSGLGSNAWFKDACRERPAVVGEVLIPFAENAIRTKTSPGLSEIYQFRNKDGPQALVQAAVSRLIDAISHEPSQDQLHILNSVLVPSGRIHQADTLLRASLEAKLEAGASRALQISLHAALLRFDGERHFAAIETVCATRDSVRELATALSEQGAVDDNLAARHPGPVSRIALLFMEYTARHDDLETDVDQSDRATTEVGERLLRQLAKLPSLQAGALLRGLQASAREGSWRHYVDWALFEQAKLARTANFSTPAYPAVCRVLANGVPANHRDLAELFRAQAIHVADRIRFDEGNLLETFYRVGKGSLVPKIENDCRDLLFSLMKDRIAQQGVMLDKEGYAAGDKRMDLRATTLGGGRLLVPIEVKKDNHAEVWTAWQHQLHARYASHPEAGGLGFYLVLWFGEQTTTPPDSRRKPRTAQEMASMLDAMIPTGYREHIVGLVIDLSPRA